MGLLVIVAAASLIIVSAVLPASQQHALNCLAVNQSGVPSTYCNETVGWIPIAECGGQVTCDPSSSAVEELALRDFGLQPMSGTIPSSIGAFVNLSYFYFTANFVSGTLPTELSLFTSLSNLDVSGNRLSGSLPETFANMPFLLGFLFNGGFLSTIPPGLFQPSIEDIKIEGNLMNGTIPTEIGLATSATSLHLNIGHASGSIPSEIALLTNLRFGSLYVYLFAPQNLTENQGVCAIGRSIICDFSQLRINCPLPANCSSCALPQGCYIPTPAPTAVPTFAPTEAPAAAAAISTPGIVGIVLGSIAGVVLIGVIVLCCVSRRSLAAYRDARLSRQSQADEAKQQRPKGHVRTGEKPQQTNETRDDDTELLPDSLAWQQSLSQQNQSVQPPDAMVRTGLNFRAEGAPGTQYTMANGGRSARNAAPTRFGQNLSVQMSRGEGQS